MFELGCDLETYYDDECTLKKLTMPEYVSHPKFKLHMGAFNGKPLWSTAEIADLLANVPRPVELVGHNIAFDGYVLYRLFGFVADRYTCTASMARGWNSSCPADLKTVCELLWPDDPTMRKGDELQHSEGVEHIDPSSDLGQRLENYCLNDERLARAIKHELLAQGFPPAELEVFDLFLRMGILPVLKADIPLLHEAFTEESENQKQIILDAANWLRPYIERHVRWKKAELALEPEGRLRKVLGSNQKFAGVLRHWGIEVPMKVSPTTGRLTEAFGKSDVEFVKTQEAYPEAANLWQARLAAKSNGLTNRAQKLVAMANADNGRIPVPVLCSGAHTHRLSGTGGVNMQNLNRGSKLRLAIRAPDGYVLVISDLSAIEARMLAWLANQHDLLEVFASGGDVYCWFATKRFGREITKADKLERQIGKACVLGLGYRMGHGRFRAYMEAGPLGADPIPTSEADARETVNAYRTINWAIANYWTLMDEVIVAMTHPECDWTLGPLRFTHETCWLPNGLPIRYTGLHMVPGQYGPEWRFMGRHGPTKLHGGVLTENVAQALAGCLLKWQLAEAMQELQEREIPTRLVMQVHDELVFCTPTAHTAAVSETVNRWMRTAPPWAAGLPLDADTDWAENYSK